MNKFTASELELLFEDILKKYKTDLSLYATASLERRLDRFFTLNYTGSATQLRQKLLSEPEYYDFFIREITVNTTEMFRDPGCWKILREQILPSLQHLPTIRIWHAGCSSGEEVYSMAILLKETGLLHKTNIVASDLNRKVMEVAKNGIYALKSFDVNSENYVASGGPGNLSDYYTVYDNQVHMHKELIEHVRFTRHDLSTGEPFSKFDLILCRNVMIYFNKALQEKVFSLFHSSLFKNGYLLIGKKETMSYYTCSREFNSFNEQERIYRLI